MKLNEHITEAVKRLKKIFIFISIILIITFLSAKFILGKYINYLDIMTYAFSPLEEIQAVMNISIAITLVIALGYIWYQTYQFIKPAFNLNKITWKLWGASTLAVISYIIGSTIVAKMLLQNIMSTSMFINQWGILSILNICFMVGIAFAIASQIIIIIPFLVNQGIIPLNKLIKIRKYVVLGLLILCGLITPTGDIISLSVVFMPLYSSYEIGIISTKINGGKQNVGSTRDSNSSSSSTFIVRSTETDRMG